jgi:hypothetical protein
LRASDLRRWCRSSSRYSWVRCIMMYIHRCIYIVNRERCGFPARASDGHGNHGNPTPPHTNCVFAAPPLTEFVAEDRLLTPPSGVRETKVPGEGRGSVLSVDSVAKIETRPESSQRPASCTQAGRPPGLSSLLQAIPQLRLPDRRS